MAQLAVAAASKRRAALATATARGALYDAGSDSAGSTSTKASSGTPAKPKSKKPEGAGSEPLLTTPQVGPGKRVRAKMTPLASSEKTPSTSTPCPKALKDTTTSPARTTPGKIIKEMATPGAKKTLEFDEGARIYTVDSI